MISQYSDILYTDVSTRFSIEDSFAALYVSHHVGGTVWEGSEAIISPQRLVVAPVSNPRWEGLCGRVRFPIEDSLESDSKKIPSQPSM